MSRASTRATQVVRFGMLAVAVAFLAVSAQPARAQQGPEKGGHEQEVWTGGGPTTKGGVHNIGIWNAGYRYAWVLTDPFGPKPLRMRFEYGFDAMPIFWFFEPGGTAYGAGLDPVVMKFNFDAGSRVVPYVDANLGFVFATRDIPPGTWHGAFASSGAVGAHILGRRGYNLAAEVRFMHISNAGLTNYNPGINTIQVRIGIGKFSSPN
jgi:Lipid A 3-O-deacylase (PagL)